MTKRTAAVIVRGMDQPRIAAIIPVFNRPLAVIEALDSVLAQTHPADRIIIIDDGSTDDTVPRIEQWRAAQPVGLPFALIRQSNAGVSSARNRGAAEADDCDLLAFLDSDDLWPADYLARMSAAFDDSSVVARVAARQTVESDGRISEVRRYDQPDRLDTQRLFVEGPPGTPNTVIRRSAFQQVGGYDEVQRCAEDYQLMLRLSLIGRLSAVTGEPVSVRRHTADVATAQLSRRYQDRRYRLAKMLDRFVHEDGGAAAMNHRIWRKRLGRVWYSAGRALRGMNRNEESRNCFQRCLACRPLHLRARWYVVNMRKSAGPDSSD